MSRDAAVLLAPGVWRIPTVVGGLVNAFAFRDADGAVTVVDAGFKRSRARLIAGLREIGAAPADVRRVVLTHAHADHAGGLAGLVAATGADVAAHEREAVYLRDGRTPRTQSGRTFSFPAVVVSDHFMDGSLLPVAGGLRVVHTPGHTPGHSSLLHEPTGVLLTGDALFNVRRISYPLGSLCTDAELNAKSADILGDLDYEIVAFSHGPEIRHGAREAVRAFLRGRVR